MPTTALILNSRHGLLPMAHKPGQIYSLIVSLFISYHYKTFSRFSNINNKTGICIIFNKIGTLNYLVCKLLCMCVSKSFGRVWRGRSFGDNWLSTSTSSPTHSLNSLVIRPFRIVSTKVNWIFTLKRVNKVNRENFSNFTERYEMGQRCHMRRNEVDCHSILHLNKYNICLSCMDLNGECNATIISFQRHVSQNLNFT